MDRNFHDFHRGEVYYADLDPVTGHEQGGIRPVLVIQNDTGNYHSPTIIVIAVTRRTFKKPMWCWMMPRGLRRPCLCRRSSAPSTSGGCRAMWAGSPGSR